MLHDEKVLHKDNSLAFRGYLSLSGRFGKIRERLVLLNGRVIDPETKLDSINNVGILNNRVAQTSSESLAGKEIISVSALVVAPGFIDLHVHGRSDIEQEYQLHDRVNTALEADITIFNPNTIIGKATFENGLEFSTGIEYVMVNGTFALKTGKMVTTLFSGNRFVESIRSRNTLKNSHEFIERMDWNQQSKPTKFFYQYT